MALTPKSLVPLLQALQRGGWTRSRMVTFGLLSALWATETFWIQATAFAVPPVTNHLILFQFVRLFLNLAVATALLLVCGRRLLTELFVASLVLELILFAYNRYFLHTFSVYFGIRALGEASQVSLFGLKLVPWSAWLLLSAAFVLKLYLLFRTSWSTARHRWRAAGVCAAAVITVHVALQFTSFRFSTIAGTRVTRAVYAYGYLTSWIAEFFVAPDTKVVAAELAELQKLSPDRLPHDRVPASIGTNVVIVQAESLGWNVLNFTINGTEVMPFLDGLARSNWLFKIEAYHYVSSGDMDYAILSGGTPSKRIVTFLVPNISYTNALPRFMQKHGFETLSFHGGNGQFFNRRSNYERMGFDKIFFMENLREPALQRSYWGVRDAELFKISSDRLNHATRPEFHFIVTLDSHGPFDLIKEEEKEVFPHSKVWEENYFNSMRALDRNLQHYIESLPQGTLVIVYGDHTSGVEYGEFHSAREGRNEFVPCFVVIAKSPAKNETPAPSPVPKDLRIHDIANWLRSQMSSR
jgi:phosphoglycerol transferase MdoB-like AlkP superfamily enzyme